MSRKRPDKTPFAVNLRMTQPPEMRTKDYIYGVEKLDGDDAWAMFVASAQGDLPAVKKLLSKDRRLVNAQYWYQMPIHLAVREGHAAVVDLLLARGADPGQSRFTYDSWDKLLARASQRGFAQVEMLLKAAMRERFAYDPDFERLQQAIVARDRKKIGTVLRRQPHLAMAADALGNNALHWSVLTRQLELLEYFVKLGTPIDALRADGHTPLLLAVAGSDYWFRETRGAAHPSLRNTWVLVGALLSLGAQYTISVAAAIGDQERVEQLLRKDAGLARRLDTTRISPLSYAADEGHSHIVRLLLEHGADPNQPQDGAPQGLALYQACQRNRIAIAELLLAHGANPNAGLDSCECCYTIGTIYHGKAALPLQKLLHRHGAYLPPYRMSGVQLKQALREMQPVVWHDEFLRCAMAKADAELLDLYLKADPKLVEQMLEAVASVYPDSPTLVRKLLSHGLDPNRADWMGRTMLHACAEHGDKAMATVLLGAGADINARELEFKATPLATAVRAYGEQQNADQRARLVRMIDFLLSRAAATNLADDPPWATPLALARAGKFADIEQRLLRHGAH